MFKRIFSYFIPINIFKRNSAISKSLEITWTNGQLVMDSENTNYSYGSLQRILRRGLKHIGFETINSMHHILVLGVAGGSVIKTLSEEVKFSGKITGVEIDPEIIQIANDYFKLNEIPNFEILICDAFEFVLKTKEKYDLIIIDIFQDSTMPNFLFEEFFVGRLGEILQPNGYILFNTMTLDDSHNLRNNQYIKFYDKKNFNVSLIPRVENHNELIVIQKIA